MSYPWYAWLSIFGVMLQFIKTAYSILVKRPLDLNLWVRFVGQFLGRILICMVFPMLILLLVMDALSRETLIGQLINALVLILFYFSGVFITGSLHQWSERHVQ